MTALLLTLALTAPAQTLSLERDEVKWPQPDVYLVRGDGYRERWVTISLWNADGSPFTGPANGLDNGWGPWSPGRTNTLNKPFSGFVPGTYRVDVRRGYNDTRTGGALITSGTFAIP